MSEIQKYAIEGVVVGDDAHHPMVFGSTCLRCGAANYSAGCSSRNLGQRVQALRERGLCEYVADLLLTADVPADLRQTESLTDAQLAELNAVAATRH